MRAGGPLWSRAAPATSPEHCAATARALPYIGDDLDVTMRVFAGLSAEQGIALHLPTAWRREDPWAALR